MALQLNIPINNVGTPSPVAYACITQIVWSPLTGRVQVLVDVFHSQAIRMAGKNPISGGVYSGTIGLDVPTLDGTTGVRAVLYTWLKTLPEFSGALDV